MCHILAASPEGNGSDDCCENDSAFHSLLRWSLASRMFLTRYVFSNRQVGASAEFHGYMLFTTARRQRNGGHTGRYHNHALNWFSP
jgi:hypothetical protein